MYIFYEFSNYTVNSSLIRLYEIRITVLLKQVEKCIERVIFIQKLFHTFSFLLMNRIAHIEYHIFHTFHIYIYSARLNLNIYLFIRM